MLNCTLHTYYKIRQSCSNLNANIKHQILHIRLIVATIHTPQNSLKHSSHERWSTLILATRHACDERYCNVNTRKKGTGNTHIEHKFSIQHKHPSKKRDRVITRSWLELQICNKRKQWQRIQFSPGHVWQKDASPNQLSELQDVSPDEELSCCKRLISS